MDRKVERFPVGTYDIIYADPPWSYRGRRQFGFAGDVGVEFVWDKQLTNPGYYTLSQCELCLAGKHGGIPEPRGSRNERQFVSERRGAHSAKPSEVRCRITRMFPLQKKIELFACSYADGWVSWGDQLDK